MNFIKLRRQRLQTLQQKRPRYRELFTFYEHLYDFFASQQESFLGISTSASGIAERHRQDGPLLAGAALHLDAARLLSFLQGLIGLMERHGGQGQEELQRLQTALAEGRLDAGQLLRACLHRRREELLGKTRQAAVEPVLTEYVLQIALSYALQRAREEHPHEEPAAWEHGFCPVCGGLPALGELYGEEGGRRLHCATCTAAWDYPRLNCAFCGNRDPQGLEYFTADGEKGYRVDVCRSCSCYLKTLDSRPGASEVPMDLEDVATVHLDLLAQREGFTRGKAAER